MKRCSCPWARILFFIPLIFKPSRGSQEKSRTFSPQLFPWFNIISSQNRNLGIVRPKITCELLFIHLIFGNILVLLSKDWRWDYIMVDRYVWFQILGAETLSFPFRGFVLHFLDFSEDSYYILLKFEPKGYDLEGDTLPRNESSKDERSVFQEERSSPRFQINFLTWNLLLSWSLT